MLRAYFACLFCLSFAVLAAEEPLVTLPASIPIVVEAPDGAKISLQSVSPDSLLFKFKLERFPPGEVLTVISKSGSKDDIFTVTTESGEQSFGISPAVPGQVGGHATIIVKRQNGEKMTINYNWGDAIQGFPIELTAPDGAKIILEMATPDALFFKLRLLHFPPREVDTVIAKSLSEETLLPAQSTDPKERVYNIAPAIPGELGGRASIVVKRPTGQNMLILYNWGKSALEPQSTEDASHAK